jgi:glycosyltransferase involved in cell wall biosynthesis
MRICLVTAFPPSRQALNEYGFHIARELAQVPGLELTILGDDLSHPEPELPEFSVTRCWSFNSLKNPWRLLRAIRKCKPDVVWFNLGFASFGGKPLPAFLGIVIPALARSGGYYTHVTLHQLMETVDLKDAGIRFPLAYAVAGFLATEALLCANSVSVLLPAYRSILRHRYGRGAVYVRSHGILSGRPEYPHFNERGNPEHRILAFGKWGTYKRLELMIEAFQMVAKDNPRAKLVIAGTDHPRTPGYLESVKQQCWGQEQIEFIGYVSEDAVPGLFQSATVAVMPYTSSAGSSGVAHLCCAYGVPIMASDIADFRQLAEEEGLSIDFFEPGDVQSLASKMGALLEDRERQAEMAIQNFSAALRMSMPEIIRQYIQTFQLQRHLGLLTRISRLRKLPRWFPMRPRLVRVAAPRLFSRSPALTLRAQQRMETLLKNYTNTRGETVLPGIAPDDKAELSLAASPAQGQPTRAQRSFEPSKRR